MRVLVADRCCVGGGVERLCTELLPALVALGAEVIWAVPTHRMTALREAGVCRAGVELVPIEWPRGSWQRYLAAGLRRLRSVPLANRANDQVHLRRVARLERQLEPDHVLYPWILGEPQPSPDGVARSIVVHDRNWTRFPENFTESADELDGRVEAWLRLANRVVVPSDVVAADVAQRWPHVVSKLTTIPWAGAAAPSYERWTEAQAAERAPLFLYPATFSPHKGHSTLLAAAGLLRARGARFRIVLTGHGTERIQSRRRLTTNRSSNASTTTRRLCPAWDIWH